MRFQKDGFIFNSTFMTLDEITEFIEPYAKEVFDGYLLIGFKADDHKVAMIGALGHPVRLPEINRKLRPVYKAAKKVLDNEENKEGLDLF